MVMSEYTYLYINHCDTNWQLFFLPSHCFHYNSVGTVATSISYALSFRHTAS